MGVCADVYVASGLPTDHNLQFLGRVYKLLFGALSLDNFDF